MRNAHFTKRCNAFTMLELMFVIVIMGVLLAVAIPRFTGSAQRAALQTTARDMARMAGIARESAIARQHPVRMVFDRDENTWNLDFSDPDDDRRSRRHDAIEDEEDPRELDFRIHYSAFQRGTVEIEENEVSVTFRPNGSSNGLIVTLVNDRKKSMTVDIEESTGRASAYFGAPKSISDRMAEAGIDPTKYEGLEAPSVEVATTTAEDTFHRIGESSDERVNRYSDIASRIMGRTRNQAERAEAQQQARGGGRGKPADGSEILTE